jgi:hypothetical protein
MRSQAEIRARFDRLRSGEEADVYGFAGEAIVEALERPSVEDLLKDPNTEWHTVDLPQTMRNYLAFAVDKALSHRGLSAVRSHEKFKVWLWCLNDQDLIDRFESADYPQYGAPKLQVIVEHLGLGSLPEETREALDTDAWRNMSAGRFCVSNCDEGCGSE